MIEEEGIVVEASGGKARVAVLRRGACDSCAASGVCHPGDASFMEAENPLGAVKGQRVRVMVAPRVYLKATFILYGTPLVALVGGAILGKNLAEAYGVNANSDLWAFLAGLGCMAVSFLIIWMYNKKIEKSGRHSPAIVEILR